VSGTQERTQVSLLPRSSHASKGEKQEEWLEKMTSESDEVTNKCKKLKGSGKAELL
jgi:hypothetical protein